MVAPKGLAAGGRKLWRQITTDHELDAAQMVQLVEVCRTKDQLDKLDLVLRGEVDTWMRLMPPNDDGEVKVVVSGPLKHRVDLANLFKQQLAALRLPDAATGKKPQRRGAARGAYTQQKAPGNVTALDRARKRRQA